MSWIDDIREYSPYNEQELKDKELILKCIEENDNLLTRENKVMHMTSSGYIVNRDRTKVLMIYHNIYNSWAWTGGHADGYDDLLHVAIKEGKEETGVIHIKEVTKKLVSLDILPVKGHMKRGEYVSAHLHLSATYLLEADEKDELIIKEDENSGVKWLPINELDKYSSEPDMVEVYEKLNRKIREMNL